MSLPRILFAWEMGENYGHVSKVAEVAAHLRGKAEIWAAVRDPIAFRQIAPDLDVHLLPAPACAPSAPVTQAEAGRNFAEVMRHVGWAHVDELAALVEAWRNLLGMVKPDVLVAQAAPTAILASRGLGFPVALVGSGYDAPPRAHPMPIFAQWDKAQRDVAPDREVEVLENANRAIARHGQPPFERFCDILNTDAFLLATFAEIDHYLDRNLLEPDHPPYLGQLATTDKGAVVSWQKKAKKRVLAYLRPGGRPFDAGVRALAQLGRDHDVILAAPGIPKAPAAKLEEAGLRVFDGPVRFDGLLPECDLGVSHASNGTAAVFLMAGVPQVTLPNHIEQSMVANALGRQKVGLGLLGNYRPEDVFATLTKVLGNAKTRENARAIADSVAKRTKVHPGQAVAQGILALT